MGFEWSLEAGGCGNAKWLVAKRVKESSGEADGRGWSACFGCRSGVFSLGRHTPGTRAEACGVGTTLDLSLRGIKKADPPLLFPQDLSGGQSLDHAHLPLTLRALPNSGLMIGK